MTLKLVPEVRKELKKPQGKLHKDTSRLLNNLEEDETISVGDQTTLNCFKKEFYPKIAIIDGKIERKPHDRKKELKNKRYQRKKKTRNPSGHITDELINTIKEALKDKKKTLIDVDGEEDLAVIPSIKFAPIGHKILYGQPGKGIVEVIIDEDSKKKVNKLIKKMELI